MLQVAGMTPEFPYPYMEHCGGKHQMDFTLSLILHFLEAQQTLQGGFVHL